MKRGFGKKGLSEVVTTLLFVLLALGAVVLVWYLVSGLIKGGTSSVNLEKACFDLEMEVVSCDYSSATNVASIIYKRGNKELQEGFTFAKMKLLFEFADGSTGSLELTSPGDIPGVLASKRFDANLFNSFGITGTAPSKVGISTILLSSGKESSCRESVRVSCA